MRIYHLDGRETFHPGEPNETWVMSSSLPWSVEAQILQIRCGGRMAKTLRRSAHAPVVAFDEPANGEQIRGQLDLRWTGSDEDGDRLGYMVQMSEDEGRSWSLLTGLAPRSSASLDTRTIAAAGPILLRVLATDGMNTTWSVRKVTFANPLRLVALLNSDSQAARLAPLDAPVTLLFTAAVDASTLSIDTFRLIEDGRGPVRGTFRSDRFTRMVEFRPDESLKPGASYMLEIGRGVRDIHGNLLETAFVGRFRTMPQ